MSAGGPTRVSLLNRSLDGLAPKFKAAVEASIAECHAEGLDAVVFESNRSDVLAAVYYKRGRPPTKEYPTPVTNAPDASWSWHGYGLAVDVISASKEWSAGAEWHAKVAAIFKKHSCDWGGDWKAKDLPHFQWGMCKPGPSDVSRTLYAKYRISEVWELVGAT